jgi:hypothetical protein
LAGCHGELSRLLHEPVRKKPDGLQNLSVHSRDPVRAYVRAIEAVKKRFAWLEGIRDWRIHASEIEVEMIEADPRIQTGCVNWPPGIGN